MASIAGPTRMRWRGAPGRIALVASLCAALAAADPVLRLAGEAIVPVRSAASIPGEDREAADLIAALAGPTATGHAPFTELQAFLDRHPRSRWAPGVGVVGGIAARRAGYFELARDTWERVWATWKDDTDPIAAIWSLRALGERVQWSVWVGQPIEVQRLLDTVGARHPTGTTAVRLETGHGFLDFARDDAVVVLKLPAYAPGCLVALARPHEPAVRIYNAMRGTLEQLGTPYGDPGQTINVPPCSVQEIRDVAAALGLDLIPVHRPPGGPIVGNSIVVWRFGFASAVVDSQPGRWKLLDWRTDIAYPDVDVQMDAFDVSGSGIWLIPDGTLPPGYTRVSDQEIRAMICR